jgi:hypothetical protein
MRRIPIGIFGLLLLSATVRAQTPAPLPGGIPPGAASAAPASPETYGTTSKTYLSLTPWDFQPIDSTTTYAYDIGSIGLTIYRTGGSSWVHAPLHLPNGAMITEATFIFCDTAASSGFGSWVLVQPRTTNFSPIPLVLSSAVETPGCVERTEVLSTPVVIDNDANSYNIEINLTQADNTIQFQSARLGYVLQVSPAPAVATFPNDVPTTHPYFRFIEALARSGVTAGCAPGSFCPDNPISRGEMAVFLSAALGLHFPN